MKSYINCPEIELKFKKGKTETVKITGSSHLNDVLRTMFDMDTIEIYETVIVIFLNNSNKMIGWVKHSQGGITGTIIDKRIICATALKCLATSVIISHNHPSGTLIPSSADLKITKELKECFKLFDINFLDHMIITEDSYYSFRDNGDL